MSIRAGLLLCLLLGPSAGCSQSDAAPAGPSAGGAVSDDATDYETEQGTSLLGTYRGGAWASVSFVVHAAELGAGPTPASASAPRGALEVTTDAGRRVSGAALRGAMLHATAVARDQSGALSRAGVRLRLDDVAPHRNLYGRASSGTGACGAIEEDEPDYVVSLSVDGAPFEPLCAGGSIYTSCSVPRGLSAVAGRALALAGDWGVGGYTPADGLVTLTCLDSVSAKCRDWGFKPWQSPALHQVCTRLARADYAGLPRPRTLDGTPIQLFTGPASIRPGYAFEAGWRVAAANEPAVLCLSKRRWSTMPLGALREGGLLDPREGEGSYCPDVPGAADLMELRRRGALLFTASPLIDAGLFRWRGPAGQSLTTARYGLARYDAAQDRADSEPGDLARLGYRPAWLQRPGDDGPSRAGFEGTLFRHPVPAPWQLPAEATALYTFTRAQNGAVVDYLTTTLRDLGAAANAPGPPRPLGEYVRGAEPEGYVLRPLAIGAPAPTFRSHRTVPLYTWYDPVGGHHLTTTDHDWDATTCQGAELCRPGDRHRSPNADDNFVFLRLEGYLLCLGCST